MKCRQTWLALALSLLGCDAAAAAGTYDAGEGPSRSDAGSEAPSDADEPELDAEPEHDAQLPDEDAQAPELDAELPAHDAEPGDGGADAAPPDDAGPGEPLDLRLSGGFVRKLEALPSGGYLVTIEAPLHLRVDAGEPRRELRWLNAQGQVERSFQLPAGRQLLDAARHASGAISVLSASNAGYALMRLDAQGVVRADLPLVDPEIGRDLPKLPDGAPSPAIGNITHDTGRIAALGEDVVLATRTGRHSVIAYRFSFDAGDSALLLRYRTLVEPAARIFPIGLTGGTYDTFSQVEIKYTVHLALAPNGLAYVGVVYPEPGDGDFAKLHQQLFGETLEGDPDFVDLYVTRVAADGTRLGTSLVGTPEHDELYGLHAFADGVYAVGRNEYWNEQGTGHQALVARVDAHSGAVQVRDFDVQRGDVAFDALPLAEGKLLVLGASGYWQNPHGASISEECDTFARVLHPDGRSDALRLPNGPRHSEARTVLALEAGRVALGGMLDGPGTHSADADATLLRADGFLIELRL